MKNQVKSRYTHCLSLTEEQEKQLKQCREDTGFSIVKLLMATVEAINTSSKPKEYENRISEEEV